MPSIAHHLKRVLPFPDQPNLLHECRRCGATVDEDSESCSECGSTEIAVYDL
ncbi:hypothetical protein C480_19549 [Natrialba aegyptia DSM 13077]|uniref:Zinc-ribbon domain-containing protein n=2 Tax=Natrialba TaxID=63742 RepID=M0ANS7_9EURY|nr:hypothetical protein C484_07341 [Natrialba taiwanensis DSM 12281]ELY99981.1 hypothetical protein C480_19549 [Natrialba aegyptia DSM 13077]